MGKSKSSRKGKKAWRVNISTEDIEEFFDKSTKDGLSGGTLTDVPSDSLFYVDKSRDLSIKKKIEKQREKVLHYESLLQRNPFVEAVPSSEVKKLKRKSKETSKPNTTTLNSTKVDKDGAPKLFDLWNEKGQGNVETKKKSTPSLIPAVEVEPSGCSFNPSFDAHQDCLAYAVAEEMQKIYKNELGPKPVPLTVPGQVMDEEEMYFLDADDGNDGDPNNETLENNCDNDLGKSSSKARRVTRVELNRRIRRKEQFKMEIETKKIENISKEIDHLPDILQEIAREDQEKQRRHLRRVVAKQERLKSGPPRLGKHKFKPSPMQVLLSEEISGSLRKLKGCCTLTRDRYKSLEKRGLVVPGAKRHRK